MRRFIFRTTLMTCIAAPGTALSAEVSFKSDILPILKSRCVVCHLPGSALGGLTLHPNGGYQTMVGIPSSQSKLMRVAPGDPDNSYLLHKLAGTQTAVGGQGERMPFGEMPLAQEQIDLIRTWIQGGALLN